MIKKTTCGKIKTKIKPDHVNLHKFLSYIKILSALTDEVRLNKKCENYSSQL